MSVFSSRRRVVSFRLSEREFEELKSVSAGCGLRSMSDFARFATQQFMSSHDGATGETIQVTLRELKARVGELELEVKRVASVVEQHENQCVSS